MITYRRANIDEFSLFKYHDSVLRRNALIAEERNEIVALFEYGILNLSAAEILNFKPLTNSKKNEAFAGLIEEMLFWNPYLKILKYNPNIEDIDDTLINQLKYKLNTSESLNLGKRPDVLRLKLKDIVPEQLSVDSKKLKIVEKWVNSPENVIVNCVKIDGEIVCIDGYSRLIAAFNKGFTHVYVHFSECEDISFYKECLKWCQEEGVRTIEDLSKRVVSTEKHKEIWIDRCQEYLKVKNDK